MLKNTSYSTKVINVMENKKIKIKVNTDFPLHGARAGEELEIEVDANGTPIDKKWRRRLRDSKIDGSIEILAPKTKPTKDK